MLVVRSQIGDESAFEELLKAYGPRLLQFTRKMMQSAPHIVEDLNQDIWLSIYRGLPGLLDASKFRPWAFRIARDRVYKEFRRRKLLVEPLPETETEAFSEGEDTSPINREELQRALNILSPEHREVLVLRFIEEMNYEEIAQITGNTLGTVRSRLHYGKRALKTVLQKLL
jgi:RNA polymerase sigma-70 factor (ECF subfamily)